MEVCWTDNWWIHSQNADRNNSAFHYFDIILFIARISNYYMLSFQITKSFSHTTLPLTFGSNISSNIPRFWLLQDTKHFFCLNKVGWTGVCNNFVSDRSSSSKDYWKIKQLHGCGHFQPLNVLSQCLWGKYNGIQSMFIILEYFSFKVLAFSHIEAAWVNLHFLR